MIDKLVYIFLVTPIFILGCVSISNENIGSLSDDWIYEPDVEIPRDGNIYIVPQRNSDLYLRPSVRSPKIGRLLPILASPTPVQVLSYYKESDGDTWWETVYQGRAAYFYTSGHSTYAPYIPSDYPPNMNFKGSYDGDKLLITGISSLYPNSAGGVDVKFGGINPSTGNTIKYLRIDISSFNSVGELEPGTISNSSSATLRKVGPIYADGVEFWDTWRNVFYNSTIVCVKINHIEIEYMDGSEEVFELEGLRGILHEEFENSCSYSDA